MATLLFIMLLLTSCTPKAPQDRTAEFVQTMPDVTAEMLSPKFWANKISNPNAEIMSAEQVSKLNQEGYTNNPWLNKLVEMPDTIEGGELLELLGAPFSDGETQFYIGNTAVTDEQWAAIRANINLDGVKDTQAVQYGFATRRSDMTFFPTDTNLTDDIGDIAYNENQTTVSHIGEPVLVCHESADKQFLYCVTSTYFGWLKKSDIALCRSKDEWIRAQNYADFLIVTGNSIKLDQNPFQPQISEMELYMGDKLPLVPVAEFENTLYATRNEQENLYGRQPFGNYIVKVPVSGAGGYMEFAYLPIPVSKDVHIGYLPYTYANVLEQAFKMQGDRYGWGGMMNARDCSSLTMEMYRCFGIELPRNGNWQEAYVGHKIDLTAMSAEEKAKALTKDVKSGAILRLSGHVMVYLGKHDGKHYCISSADGVGEYSATKAEYEYKRIRTVAINTLEDTRRASGKTWLEELTHVICLSYE